MQKLKTGSSEYDKEIKDLIKVLDDSNVAEFQLKKKDFELRLRSNQFFENKGASVVTAPMQIAAPSPVAPAAPAAPAAAPAAPAPSSSEPADSANNDANLIEIKSPMVGTFYRSSSPDKPAFVSVGDSVQSGSVVCIIEAMKLFNEIESEVSGKIVKVLVDNAQPVEYDQPLFLVEPS